MGMLGVQTTFDFNCIVIFKFVIISSKLVRDCYFAYCMICYFNNSFNVISFFVTQVL
jgi:hypothetical protein